MQLRSLQHLNSNQPNKNKTVAESFLNPLLLLVSRFWLWFFSAWIESSVCVFYRISHPATRCTLLVCKRSSSGLLFAPKQISPWSLYSTVYSWQQHSLRLCPIRKIWLVSTRISFFTAWIAAIYIICSFLFYCQRFHEVCYFRSCYSGSFIVTKNCKCLEQPKPTAISLNILVGPTVSSLSFGPEPWTRITTGYLLWFLSVLWVFR